ncbi:MAG: PhzF family phenazine biosynthesis protein [Gloeomargaritaceae cyanobacterium C42_A2020_066]|nr:PhzF family phenazine biosynthesis protein [Gloeomargaritaceae cyanobacterium C42_A2020_066]
MAHGLPVFQVDAFATQPYSGNPAAVCILDAPRPADWCLHVAQEMNLSETAFLELGPEGSYSLRWFTPAVEVDLCGHATLASAHVLWEAGYLAPATEARFLTRSGTLTAQLRGDWIHLDFPATPCTPVVAPAGLEDALGAQPVAVGRTQFDLLVELASEADVRVLTPDFAALAHMPVRGVIVTAASPGQDYDFVSRFFVPAAGINEDPVTGSAHCGLGPYWQARLGKSELLGYQASARGGYVQVGCRGERVDLAGRAVTIWRGELLH